MKIAVIGSRILTNINISKYIPKNISLLISGGADGIDTLAEKWANVNNIPVEIIKPEYGKYRSKIAPIIRNKIIVEKAELIIAIWDGKSRGSFFTINYAKKVNKPVKIHLIST